MMWLMKIFSKGNKKRAGFTLVELMIVVIVVGILAAAAIPIYQRSMDKARASEGKALLGTARTHYITEVAGGTAPTVPASLEADWGIDTSKNKWWKTEVTDFAVDWTNYTLAGNYKIRITGISGGTNDPIKDIILEIECETGDFSFESYP